MSDANLLKTHSKVPGTLLFKYFIDSDSLKQGHSSPCSCSLLVRRFKCKPNILNCGFQRYYSHQNFLINVREALRASEEQWWWCITATWFTLFLALVPLINFTIFFPPFRSHSMSTKRNWRRPFCIKLTTAVRIESASFLAPMPAIIFVETQGKENSIECVTWCIISEWQHLISLDCKRMFWISIYSSLANRRMS